MIEQQELSGESIMSEQPDTGRGEQFERALPQQPDLLERVVNSSVDGILAFDRQYHFTLWNPAMERVSGMPKAQVLGNVAFEVFPFLKETGEDRILEQVLQGKDVVSSNRPYRIPETGQEGFFEGHYSPLYDNSGQIIGGLAIVRDITERKRMEDALRESEANFRAVVEQASEGIALFTPEGYCIQVNPRLCEITGYEADELIGRHVAELVDPKSLEGVPIRYDEVNTGKTVRSERLLKRKDGSLVPVEGNTKKLDDGRVQVVLRDITERKEAEQRILRLNEELERQVAERTAQISTANEALVAHQSLLQIMLDASPVGIALYDCEMRVVSANTEWARMMGVDLPFVSGRVLYDLVPSSKELRPIHQRVLAGEEVDSISQPIQIAGQDKFSYYDVRRRPIFDANGAVTGMLAVLIDVTEREELDRRKDSFLALASHELRTPITTVKGYAQAGLRTASAASGSDPTKERLARTLRIINEQADRLTRLVNDLLDVSRIQSDTLDFQRESFDLRDVVREVAGNLELLAPEFMVRLDLQDTPALVHADLQRIEQVATNLAQNAIKYSGEGRAVNIRMRVTGDEVITSVRDYGVGIPADQLAHVFERFFRAANVRRHHAGLGLGLFISYRIITRHGGRMWVESIEGEGSTFHFALPVVTSDE
jgi:two-component system, OmpR family, phosphate regulon sensor histidine kinase PhoR